MQSKENIYRIFITAPIHLPASMPHALSYLFLLMNVPIYAPTNLATCPLDLISSLLQDNVLAILSALFFITSFSLLLDYFHQLNIEKCSRLKLKSKKHSQPHIYLMLSPHVSIILTFNQKELSTCYTQFISSLLNPLQSSLSLLNFYLNFFAQDHL